MNGGFGITGEFLGVFGIEPVLLDLFLVTDPALVAVVFPALKVLNGEAGVTELFEGGADFFISDAIVEHLVDLIAEFAREVSDLAGAPTGSG